MGLERHPRMLRTQSTYPNLNANNLKHSNLADFRNNVQRVELVAVLQCGSQRRDPGLSDDVR